MKKILLVLGYLLLFMFVFAVLFKLQHWPGSSVLLITCLTLFNLPFLPLFFLDRILEQKTPLNITVNLLAMFTTMLIFMGVLFKLQLWPGGSIMLIAGAFFLLIPTLILYIVQQFREKQKKFSEYRRMVFTIVLIGVLLIFLAQNVSRNILNDFAKIEDASLATNTHLSRINSFLLKEIIKKDSVKSQGLLKVNISTQGLLNSIEQVKKELILKVADEAALSDHWQIEAKGNYDVTTYFLGNADSKEMNELAIQIKAYNHQVVETFKLLSNGNEAGVADLSKNLLDVNPDQRMLFDYEAGLSWQETLFAMSPVSDALAILSNLQTQVLNLQTMLYMKANEELNQAKH